MMMPLHLGDSAAESEPGIGCVEESLSLRAQWHVSNARSMSGGRHHALRATPSITVESLARAIVFLDVRGGIIRCTVKPRYAKVAPRVTAGRAARARLVDALEGQAHEGESDQ
jgi:hypothetical protein